MIFSRMIDEYRSGKKVLYVTEKGNGKVVVNGREEDQKICRRYQIFLDYYFGGQFPMERTDNYEKIDQNSVVICSNITIKSKDFPAIRQKMQENGLKLSVPLCHLLSPNQ